MVLVEYSDSDSDSDKTSAPLAKRPANATATYKRRRVEDDLNPVSLKTPPPPPLPSNFHSLYATNVRTSTTDDPSLHGGRKRQVVHVQGNWPSHIYLEWLPNKFQLMSLDDLIIRSQHLITTSNTMPRSKTDLELHSFLRSHLSAQLPLHISLSAPLVLTTSNKEDFYDRLNSAITKAKIGTIAVKPVSLDLVPNFERSRWFLVLRVVAEDAQGQGNLSKLLGVCNAVCGQFGLLKLYERGGDVGVDFRGGKEGENCEKDADRMSRRDGCGVEPDDSKSRGGGDDDGKNDIARAFHISIAWMLGEASTRVREIIQGLDLEELSQVNVDFTNVKIKIGNVVNDVSL